MLICSWDMTGWLICSLDEAEMQLRWGWDSANMWLRCHWNVTETEIDWFLMYIHSGCFNWLCYSLVALRKCRVTNFHVLIFDFSKSLLTSGTNFERPQQIYRGSKRTVPVIILCRIDWVKWIEIRQIKVSYPSICLYENSPWGRNKASSFTP